MRNRFGTISLSLTFSVGLALFFEFELTRLYNLQHTYYWHAGAGFYFLMLIITFGMYAPLFLKIAKDFRMKHTKMLIKRSLHYLLHYFTLPTFLYLGTLTLLYFLSSVVMQQVVIALTTVSFFAVLICALKVVQCSPKGYEIPESKKLVYYYICRLKFCFFYKLYVAFLSMTSLYVLSLEHIIPAEVLPLAVGVTAYILLAHNMLFTLRYSWSVQKRAFIDAFLLAAISVLIRIGKIHFLVAGLILLIFYHVFEGLFFHRIEKLGKEILQKYVMMGVIALLVIWGSFDKDFGGSVQLPDEQYARISQATMQSGTGQVGMLAISAGLIGIVLLLTYFLLSRRVARLAKQEEEKDRLFTFRD